MNWRRPDERPTGQSPVFLRSSRWLVEQCLKVKVADVQARYGKDQIVEAATGTRQLWWPLAPGYCQEVQVAIRPHPRSVGQRHFRNRFYQQVLGPLARVSRLRRLLQKQAQRAGRD
jgi:hypothetical protein